MNAKQSRFVEEYLIDLNATQAAIRAGYSAKTAEQQGPRLLGNAGVQAAVAKLQQKRSEATGITAADVLREWTTIASASPAELIRYRLRACRYCHGKEHLFQWISELEWQRAVEKVEAENLTRKRSAAPKPLPSNAGGYGYTNKLKPVESCLQCLGDGQTDVLMPDTSTLSPAALKLYAGIKQTKDGIEVKMRDQDAALVNVAKHLGMFVEKVEVEANVKGGVTYRANMPMRKK